MKAGLDLIIQRPQAEYLERLHAASTGIAAEMEAHAERDGVPIADPEVAKFLEITTRAIKAKHVLEIGMAIGYSVLHFVRGMEQEGTVVTIELKREMIEKATGYFERAGITHRVQIEEGAALDVLPRVHDTFDLAFIDAVKEEYEGYLELILPKLRKGGIVLVDNLLWGGQVAGELRSADQKASTEALRKFNGTFVRHPGLLAQVLPVGDGLGYAVKL